MLRPIDLRPDMGAEIIRHLRQFADLPDRGILAGQAVDSAITDLWSSGGGVYNDLDIFRQGPMPKQKDVLEKASATANRSRLQLVTNTDYGTMQRVLETVDTYGIASVSRHGMLNYVNCYMASGHIGQKLSAHRVLSGFDLNCVRVGVDLSTGLLYWDRHYQEFQQSRQLKIAMMHTPWHTFLRVMKKREELPGVYLDVDLAAEACTAVAQSEFIRKMLTDKDVSLLFGSKHLELARQQESALSSYFELAKVTFSREKRDGRRVPAQWTEDRPLEVESSSAAQERVDLWQLRPKGAANSALQARINALGKGALFFAYQAIEEARRKKKDQVYVKLDALKAHRLAQGRGDRDRVLGHLEYFSTRYVEGQALPAVSDKVEAYFAKHAAFSHLLLGYSLAEQWKTIQRVKSLVARFGKEYLDGDTEGAMGVIETQCVPADLQDEEGLWAFLVADFKKNSAPFEVEPLALPKVPAKWQHYEVRELLTPELLRREGQQMGHCVGGYAHAVRSGRSRIVSLRVPGQSSCWSTAELQPSTSRKTGLTEYTLVQHRAKANKAPHDDNTALFEYLLRYLNLSQEGRRQLEAGHFVPWAQARHTAAQRQADSLKKTHERLQTALKAVRVRLDQASLALKSAESDWEVAALMAEPSAQALADELAQLDKMLALPPAQDPKSLY